MREISAEYGAIVDVTLAVGAVSLVARVTRKAVEDLRIEPGLRVHVLVKAVAIDRRSVGFA